MTRAGIPVIHEAFSIQGAIMEVDTQKDIQFYSHLVNTLGQTKADIVAPTLFAEDLNWMSWEACRDSVAKAFFYKIIDVNGDKRLVNQRDLSDNEDILKKINREVRGGLELRQMSIVRSRLLSAENGAVAAWISPKKMVLEDPDYPLDQINIAKKIDEETVWVKQLQGEFAPEYLASIVNSPSTKLTDLMLNIGETDLGQELDIHQDNIKNLDKGQSYVLAIKQGLSADSLRVKRADLLRGTIPYVVGLLPTSCGFLDFGMPKTALSGIMTEVKTRNWCSGCQIENSCTAKCFRCGGQLSSKPVSYI
jgi:hypothetical protein